MKHRILIGLLMGLALASCGTPTAPTGTGSTSGTTTAATAGANAAAPSATLSAADLQAQMNSLVTGPLAQLVAASASGNKDQIQQAFNSFDSSWVKIEGQVKTQSPDSYKAIEDAVTQLQDAAVRAQVVDPATVQKDTQQAITAITSYIATIK